MSGWRRQAVIDAPVEVVWDLVGDPRRHPEWFPRVLAVSDLGEVEQDGRFRQVTRSLRGRIETTLAIEQLQELRAINMRCLDTGTYVRFLLTEAQDRTFADIEIGLEPTGASLLTPSVPRKSRLPSALTVPPWTGISSEVATARRVTPAQATSACSSMSPEHRSDPSPPEAGCRPAAATAAPVRTEQLMPSSSVPVACSVTSAALASARYRSFSGACRLRSSADSTSLRPSA